jgi:AGZA family xanthine/uracil permease-like MFS transporter
VSVLTTIRIRRYLLLLLPLQGKRLHSPTLWLGAAGLGFMAVLMAKRVKGALMLGIVFTTAISWIPGHAASYLGAGSQVPGRSSV